MEFHEGDTVMHWTHGLGQVIRLEERTFSGSKTLYYAVQVRDLTVWVPADGKLGDRLRVPVSQSEFKKLRAILSGPSESLPDDRKERRTRLLALLKHGRVESTCQIVRDLTAYQKVRSLNDNDQLLLKQSRNLLLEEWGFVLSVTEAQAELELHRLLRADAHETEA
jgi:RNA polymerase-interacting CarD/CdnL/TRCF family regulator